MPLLSKRSVLLAKAEGTSGTAESPTASDGVFNIYDARMDPVEAFIMREGQSTFSPLAGVVGVRMGRCSFRTSLVGGATIPQAWSVLMPACGWVDTADVFSPVSNSPGNGGVTTATLVLYTGMAGATGLKKMLHGCAGNWRMEFVAGQPVSIFWEFLGIWNAPTDATVAAPDYPTETPLRFASSAISIGGAYTPRLARMTLDSGNSVVMIEDSTTVSGCRYAMVTSRRINGTMDPEGDLVANRDWYGVWLGLTEASLAWTLGTTGNQVAFSAPKFQVTSLTAGNRNNIVAEQVAFQFNRSADAGDDDLTMTVK